MDKAVNFVSRSETMANEFSILTPEGKVGFGWQIEDLNPQGACGNASAADARAWTAPDRSRRGALPRIGQGSRPLSRRSYRRSGCELSTAPETLMQRFEHRSLRSAPVRRISAADTNYFVVLFDPERDHIDPVCVVEIFTVGGRTPPNAHMHAHEFFYVLSGEGIAHCDGASRAIVKGDALMLAAGAAST